MRAGWSACSAAGGRRAVTPLGQLPFVTYYLEQAGLVDPIVAYCPLDCTASSAPAKRDRLGTLVLRLLTAAKRYAHITALRNDSVDPALLSMERVCSRNDSVRRGLRVLDPQTPGLTQLSTQRSRIARYSPCVAVGCGGQGRRCRAPASGVRRVMCSRVERSAHRRVRARHAGVQTTQAMSGSAPGMGRRLWRLRRCHGQSRRHVSLVLNAGHPEGAAIAAAPHRMPDVSDLGKIRGNSCTECRVVALTTR